MMVTKEVLHYTGRCNQPLIVYPMAVHNPTGILSKTGYTRKRFSFIIKNKCMPDRESAEGVIITYDDYSGKTALPLQPVTLSWPREVICMSKI